MINKRNIFNIASLYLGLYVLTFTITFTLLMLVQPVVADDCGYERTQPPFLLAYGENTENYDKYGIKAEELITDFDLCGSSEADGSLGGALVAVFTLGSDIIETGFFEGYYSSMSAVDEQHYYWGKRYDGTWSYSDISDGTGKVPNEDDWILFETRGNGNTSDHDWHVKIERDGDYTINIDGLTIDAAYGLYSRVVFETHNNETEGSANFTNIEHLKKESGNLNWVDWEDSDESRYPNNSTNPYQVCKVSETEYYMYTGSGSCP